jgi:hypothetical protein
MYYELKRADEGLTPFSESEIREAFKELQPKFREMPVQEDNEFWMGTGAFLVGSNAPQSRQGTLRSLTDALVKRARAGRDQRVRIVA